MSENGHFGSKERVKACYNAGSIFRLGGGLKTISDLDGGGISIEGIPNINHCFVWSNFLGHDLRGALKKNKNLFLT